MNNESKLRSRDRVDAGLDVPDARVSAPQHEEWVIDEAGEESFPASDAPTPVQPGSLASQHYARTPLRVRPSSPVATALILFCAAAAGMVIGLLLKRRTLLDRLR
jgi:hypothetical protein